MKYEFKAKAVINVDASPSEVWNALTNPEIIKQYLFGTEAISDWKVGSKLEFKGEWEGKEYFDKGIITKFEPEKILQYTYLSSFSTLEDIPENYNTITCKLQKRNGSTELTLTQDNIPTEESKNHSEQNWNAVLKKLKEIVEQE
ncbi:MAG TPA: SRPBCC family protein [Ignavibacteriaceae bacterium]|nr:SRPBCC family protein [Ignavibacteriaceae bacterium]